MIKHLFTVLLVIISFSISAQSAWTKANINSFRQATEENQIIMPSAYESYTLELEELLESLEDVPVKGDQVRAGRIALPMPDGSFETYEIFEASVMAPGLSAKFPMIKSYKGISISNPLMNIRFSTSTYGFHAAITDNKNHEVYYIDPFSKGNLTEYIVYNVKDQPGDLTVPTCGVESEISRMNPASQIDSRNAEAIIPLRKYRFAIACTGEWGAIRGTPENAMSDFNIAVNRINQIFENELAITLEIVEDNELLLFFNGATDPYNIAFQSGNGNTSSDESAAIGINTQVINDRIGFDSYDVGHVFHTNNCNVGGIAFLGAMCNAGIKGGGLTCHGGGNISNTAARTTSHEIGHMMTAQHTFNHCDQQNESPGNAYEPGSGTTIMSYAGGCGPQNSGNGADNYHSASLIQIYNHTRNGGGADGCAEIIESTNEEPIITLDYTNGFTIPEDCHFFLEGSATDANDDILTYSWEQFNIGPLSNLGTPVGDAPHFRVYPPTTSSTRFFPNPSRILSGQSDITEVAFLGDRSVNFVFVVRDNNADAGTSVWEFVEFKVKDVPGKFEVTSQDMGQTSYKAGQEIDVTWEVATTDLAPINAKFVDIYFYDSQLNDFNFSSMVKVASGVKNNGSAKVTLPNADTNRGRLIVKASDNIFFSINKRNFQVTSNDTPTLTLASTPTGQSLCFPDFATFEIDTEALGGLEGDVKFEIADGLPDLTTITFDPPTVSAGESTTMSITFSDYSVNADYAVSVRAYVEGVDTMESTVYLYTTSTDHSLLQGVTPVDGQEGVEVSPKFNWTKSPNADTYSIQVSTTPSFDEEDILISETGISDSFYVASIILEKKEVYYWRVIPTNLCGEGKPMPVNAFSVEALECVTFTPDESQFPINISQSGTPSIEGTVDVLGGTIADINVTSFFGEHDNNRDMNVYLVSPEGKEVLLFGNICDQADFNCQFDDASNSSVKCPLNNGKTYRPKEELAEFNGDIAEGTWVLRIDDTKSGNGGRLEGFALEVCASVNVQSPYIVNNNVLKLPWGGTPTISSSKLKVEDNNNISSQLVFTVVVAPDKGQLLYNGNPVIIGDQYTQKDINDGKLIYAGEEENYNTYFSFTVIDGEGGFLGITNFNIEVDELNATFDPSIANEISIFPIPATDRISIDMSTTKEIFTSFEIVNINGQTIKTGEITGSNNLSIDVSAFAKGVYIINIENDNYSIPKKIIVE